MRYSRGCLYRCNDTIEVVVVPYLNIECVAHEPPSTKLDTLYISQTHAFIPLPSQHISLLGEGIEFLDTLDPGVVHARRVDLITHDAAGKP